MDRISEDVKTFEMKPIQPQEEFEKTLEQEDIFGGVFLKKGADDESDDDMFLFGVGGPA
jgi:hypothetical protein